MSIWDAVAEQEDRERRATLDRVYGEDWQASAIGRCRDSGLLERANWQAIYADLRERFPRVEGADEDAWWDVMRMGHWGVGWVEHLVYREDTPAAEVIREWEHGLADYPVASDSVYSDMEWEEGTEEAERLRDYIAADQDITCTSACAAAYWATDDGACIPECLAKTQAADARDEAIRAIDPVEIMRWLSDNCRSLDPGDMGHDDVAEAIAAIIDDGWVSGR